MSSPFNTSIINAEHLWGILQAEAKANHCTPDQHHAIYYLQQIARSYDVNMSTFAQLEVDKVEDILSIFLMEVDDRLYPVVNGRWMRVAIEGDGYLVLTGSNLKHPVTGYPPSPFVTT